jgi:hypothetical protein
MGGWTKKPRSRFEHHLFAKEKFCRGYAWDWLVDHAAFKPLSVDVSGRTVELQRGQLCYSIRFLAKAWNWDKAAVSRFLTRLKTETMIETHTETGQTIITICNYEKFNAIEPETETGAETPPETEARQQRDSSETNKKKYKKDKKEETPPKAPQGADLFGGKPKDPSPVEILTQIIPQQLAEDFVEHRRRMGRKHHITNVAARLLVKQWKGKPNVVGAFEQSIRNGWQGVFEVKQETRRAPGVPGTEGIKRMIQDRNQRRDMEPGGYLAKGKTIG